MKGGLFQNKYRIKTTRLFGWDYGWPGYYYVTICVQDRICCFGDVVDEKMVLNELGDIVQQSWQEIPHHFSHVELDEFVVMPNHLHGILKINKKVETQNFASLRKNHLYENKFGSQSMNLASIIRGFKIGVTKWPTMDDFEFKWQKRFYDHIVRDEEDLNRIRQYIRDNPKNWPCDRNKKNFHEY